MDVSATGATGVVCSGPSFELVHLSSYVVVSQRTDCVGTGGLDSALSGVAIFVQGWPFLCSGGLTPSPDELAHRFH
jgi:hypothetical protein